MRSEKDLKISLFPLLRVKGAGAQKNVFRVTVIFFWSRLPKNFWSSAATFEEGLPLWKKEAKRRHETSTLNQLLSLLLFSREEERLCL